MTGQPDFEPETGQRALFDRFCDYDEGHTLLLRLMANRHRHCRRILENVTLARIRAIVGPFWASGCGMAHCPYCRATHAADLT